MAFVRIRDQFSDISNAENGIGLYLGGGYLINRNSTVNLRIFGAASLPFYSVNNQSFQGFKFGIVTSFAR